MLGSWRSQCAVHTRASRRTAAAAQLGAKDAAWRAEVYAARVTLRPTPAATTVAARALCIGTNTDKSAIKRLF